MAVLVSQRLDFGLDNKVVDGGAVALVICSSKRTIFAVIMSTNASSCCFVDRTQSLICTLNRSYALDYNYIK